MYSSLNRNEECLFEYQRGMNKSKQVYLYFFSVSSFSMETFEPLCAAFQWIAGRISEFLGKRSGKSITATRSSRSKQDLSMVIPFLLKALKLSFVGVFAQSTMISISKSLESLKTRD